MPSILTFHGVDSPFPRVSTLEGEVSIYYAMLSSTAGVEWYFLSFIRLSAMYSLEMVFAGLSATELGSP